MRDGKHLGVSCLAADRVIVDPTVVRGLEYYTGRVVEAELTFETPGKNGRPIRFGARFNCSPHQPLMKGAWSARSAAFSRSFAVQDWCQ